MGLKAPRLGDWTLADKIDDDPPAVASLDVFPGQRGRHGAACPSVPWSARLPNRTLADLTPLTALMPLARTESTSPLSTAS